MLLASVRMTVAGNRIYTNTVRETAGLNLQKGQQALRYTGLGYTGPSISGSLLEVMGSVIAANVSDMRRNLI